MESRRQLDSWHKYTLIFQFEFIVDYNLYYQWSVNVPIDTHDKP